MPGNNERSNPKPRIESLSDLIFGLALSLSAYSLLTRPPTTLMGIATDVFAFTFSFLILISVWIRYTSVMSVLPMENRTTMLLNVLMLFSVSLEPYLFNLVSLFGHASETEVVEYASLLYAADMAILVIILAFFTHVLATEERQLIAAELIKPYRKVRNAMLVSAGLFLLTMAPPLWTWRFENMPLRFFLWLVPLGVFWIGRFPERSTSSSRKLLNR